MSVTAPASTNPPPTGGEFAVRVRGLVKRYGSVTACDGVDLDLACGQIHGVLGENGAGKSTLMKVLIGLVQPDEGTIELAGRPCRIDDPATAAAHGIGMVHQHFSLVDELRVWENVVLGETSRLDAGAARRLVRSIGERYGIEVDPDARVADLTVGFRQRVEIIKCLRRDPSIVIFDEPTSVLTPAESEQLFGVLRSAVADQGKAVALVSHKLEEIQRATDVVTILRGGRVARSGPTSDFDQRSLAQAMVGRPVSLRSEAAALGLSHVAAEVDVADADADEAPPAAAPVLEIRDVTVETPGGHRPLDGIDLVVRPGEIVGVAGVEGNGQSELAELLESLRGVTSGEVVIGGTVVDTSVAGATSVAGLAIVPEDRHDAGCVLDLSVEENLALAELGRGAGLRRVDRDAMRHDAERLIDEFDISCAGPGAPFRSLSGGNQQRVVLARELSSDPIALVACQPTRGLDVGATEFMAERLRAAADRGVGVLLISSELDEILHLADRVVVMFDGRIVGSMDRADADIERVGMLMGGARAPEEATS